MDLSLALNLIRDAPFRFRGGPSLKIKVNTIKNKNVVVDLC